MIGKLSLSLFVLCVSFLTLEVSGQTTAAQVIDGSVHPELIPDSLANRLVLISLALPANPTAMDAKKQNIRLGRLNLDRADLAQFTTLLANFSRAYSKWRASVTTQDPAAAAADKNQLVSDFFFFAEQHLSPGGFHSLQGYIQYEKRKMTVPQ